MRSVRLMTDTPAFLNDLADVVRLIWGACDIRPDSGDIAIVHEHLWDGDTLRETCTVSANGVPDNADIPSVCEKRADGSICRRYSIAVGTTGVLTRKRAEKRAAKSCLFLLLCGTVSGMPPWGALTGIRPTRLFYEALAGGMDEDAAERHMQEAFYVSRSRAGLLREIIDMQRGLIDRAEDEFDLYAGIPFCRTRCSYCSFAAGELGDGKRVEPYVDALVREMELCAEVATDKGLRIRAGYIGGGTPTAISAVQLRRVINAAQRLYPGAREWTVEAGRPDTIDREKLAMLRELGIGRICVNPQTFNDETLLRVGRAHTGADTLAAFALAREMGFSHINMDFIAALPGETAEDFHRSIATAIKLAPESITVHALAIKHSSRLNEQKYAQSSPEQAQAMVEEARAMLAQAGYRPYYLYRQKYMAGNLENVGYALPGCACLYNIDNMEETTPVLAFGAGAISKWLYPGRGEDYRDERIERAPNLRNIDEYTARVGEMAARKLALLR